MYTGHLVGYAQAKANWHAGVAHQHQCLNTHIIHIYYSPTQNYIFLLPAAYIHEYLGWFVICCLANFDIWFAIFGVIVTILVGLASLGILGLREDW